MEKSKIKRGEMLMRHPNYENGQFVHCNNFFCKKCHAEYIKLTDGGIGK